MPFSALTTESNDWQSPRTRSAETPVTQGEEGWPALRALTTARFPSAAFVPREIRGLPVPLPGSGQATVQIRGALTIRDVTRPTTWEGTVEFRGSTVRLQARTAFTFADSALTQPRVMRVLSIEDHIRLEVDLTLRPAS